MPVATAGRSHMRLCMAFRYGAPDLIRFASDLLRHGGLEAEKSSAVAEILAEGDLLGHTTHGLQLLAPYLIDLENGHMTKTGAPLVLADFPAAITWDGRHLPGPWLVLQAIGLAADRAKTNGMCTVVIRSSHHIACLAAYLKRVTDQNLMVLLSCSDPRPASVAPHGGRRPLYTPNPIAAAWPTGSDPVMLDVSLSITSNGFVNRCRAEGRRLPGPWLIDHEGNPTDDPAAAFTQPPGALLPIGGLDHGHKGYALGLLVETLTSGLAGRGRADPQTKWTANVFLQVIDPALFGGAENFLRQTAWLSTACHDTPPRPGFDRVRLPGESGLRRREAQLKNGVELHPGILPALAPWAQKLGVAPPAPLT
ncbi:MAG TPA: Ldh family oxidoreductase [Opitutaceae bacterium]|nr:Ldh family oxidoreductase [Opitutaceae bacterium]